MILLFLVFAFLHLCASFIFLLSTQVLLALLFLSWMVNLNSLLYSICFYQGSLGHKLKVDERNNKGMYVRFKYGVYMAVKNGSKEGMFISIYFF